MQIFLDCCIAKRICGIQSEAKNFDKENLHVPKIDRVVCTFFFKNKNVCDSSACFMNADYCMPFQNQKTQFPRSIERTSSVLFSLVFLWRNV
jgi:hypothetical protein